MNSFDELNALVRELLPACFHNCEWKNGVIAIMGSSPRDAFVYRCGRDSCGDAMLPTGWYTYFVVRDGDDQPMKMSDSSAYSRVPCEWTEFAEAVRRIADKQEQQVYELAD